MNTPNTNNTPIERGWSEDDSAFFLRRADVFVPSRQEQIETLLGLIPAAPDEAFTIAELAAGGGALAAAILAAFPHCRYIALDGSEVMRERLRETLAHAGERIEVRDFELAGASWREQLPQPLRCVVSSLTVHHLPGEGKRQLFADLAPRLETGAALLIADIIAPAVSPASAVFAQQWDAAARAQSLAAFGDLSGYEDFQQTEWNYYVTEQDDPYDRPSRLFEQLLWLRDAGFSTVDCFWMRAGHAIYGGYR